MPRLRMTFGLVACVATATHAQCLEQRFFPDFQARSLEFGVDVKINDDHLIIADRFGGASIYTYRKDPGTGAWVFNHTVPYGDGADIDLDGDRLITGSFSVPVFGGAVVYDFDGERWNEATMLMSPDDPGPRFFAESVALHGNVAAVGNWGTTVLIFRKESENWELVDELTQPSGRPIGSEFGTAMAMDGRWLIVSASTEDISSSQNGAVYIYECDAEGVPMLSQKLQAEPFPLGPRLGHAVAIDGETLVVGAWGYWSDDDFMDGRAYVYEFDGGAWEQVQILHSTTPQHGGHFGWDVAIDGDLIAVGARSEGDFPGFGSTHVFRRGIDGQWFHSARVELDINGLDYGEAVAIGNGQLVVGSSEVGHMGEDQGVADVFNLSCLICHTDLDGDGTLSIFDYLVFFNAFDAGDPVADFDGDGEFTIFDFLAYQTAFDLGCE